jgi:hypothetical protein
MEDRSVTSWDPGGEKTTSTGCPYAGIGHSIEPCYWINPKNSLGVSSEMIGNKHRCTPYHNNSVEVMEDIVSWKPETRIEE